MPRIALRVQSGKVDAQGLGHLVVLILPKIVATVLFFPFLAILSILIGIAGGYLISSFEVKELV